MKVPCCIIWWVILTCSFYAYIYSSTLVLFGILTLSSKGRRHAALWYPWKPPRYVSGDGSGKFDCALLSMGELQIYRDHITVSGLAGLGEQ